MMPRTNEPIKIIAKIIVSWCIVLSIPRRAVNSSPDPPKPAPSEAPLV